MAGRSKRNSRKQRKARAKSYHPAVVVRARHARRLQGLDNEELPGEIQLDRALTRGRFSFGHYLTAAAAFISGTALTVTEFFKR